MSSVRPKPQHAFTQTQCCDAQTQLCTHLTNPCAVPWAAKEDNLCRHHSLLPACQVPSNTDHTQKGYRAELRVVIRRSLHAMAEHLAGRGTTSYGSMQIAPSCMTQSDGDTRRHTIPMPSVPQATVALSNPVAFSTHQGHSSQTLAVCCALRPK